MTCLLHTSTLQYTQHVEITGNGNINCVCFFILSKFNTANSFEKDYVQSSHLIVRFLRLLFYHLFTFNLTVFRFMIHINFISSEITILQRMTHSYLFNDKKWDSLPEPMSFNMVNCMPGYYDNNFHLSLLKLCQTRRWLWVCHSLPPNTMWFQLNWGKIMHNFVSFFKIGNIRFLILPGSRVFSNVLAPAKQKFRLDNFGICL